MDLPPPAHPLTWNHILALVINWEKCSLKISVVKATAQWYESSHLNNFNSIVYNTFLKLN